MKFNQTWITRAMAAACLLAPAAARGQSLHPSFSVDAGFDTRGSNFYGTGMYLGLPGRGPWTPYVETYAYYLNYPAGATRGSLKAFVPTVGLSYGTGRSSVNFGVGYAFVSKGSVPSSINTERGGESGVTASFGAHTAGPGDRPYKAEFLANQNFGSNYLWTRTRASVPLGYSTAHPARIGLELGVQGSNKNGNSSHSVSFGPVLEYGLTSKMRFTVAGGPKFYSNRGTGAYIGMSLSFSP